MTHSSLLSSPPVLVDIGASGTIHKKWNPIAKYAICIAFDADSRDFEICESEDKGWRKLYSMNRLVASEGAEEMDFYLTHSPHCSSSLAPDQKALEPWAFSPLFEVDQVVKLPAVDLHSVLEKIGITYIDWYKTDSQGTDLRIFDALPKSIIRKIISAEFEPGIIDAYMGEDKLHQLMAYMDKQPFWVSHMEVKGSQRIDQDDLQNLNYLKRRFISSFLKTAPGWCEISYINKLSDKEMSCREYLLGWVFATMKGEHGFAIQAAKDGAIKFEEPLFNELNNISHNSLSSASGVFKVAVKASKKVLRILS